MSPARIARVVIESPLPHLDRLFDYLVPDALADKAAIGTRVRVKFAGRLISAVVCDLAAHTDHEGTLSPIKSAATRASYTPEAIQLAQQIARRYGGGLWDV